MVKDTHGHRNCGLEPDLMELLENVPTKIQGSGEGKAPEGRIQVVVCVAYIPVCVLRGFQAGFN